MPGPSNTGTCSVVGALPRLQRCVAAPPGPPAVAQFASGGILSIPSSLHRSYTTANYTSPQQLASKLTL